MAPRFGSRKICYSLPLLLSIFVLIGSTNCRYGADYSTYYHSGYSIKGTHLYGCLPTCVQTVDADCMITQGVAADEFTSSNPSRYALGGSTSLVSGDLTDLASDNNVYTTFRSYDSGSHTIAFATDDTSDVDFSADKGTQSNFSALQAGPDSIHETLTEENASVTVDDWGITSGAFTGTGGHSTYRYMGGMSPNIDNMTVTKLHLRYSGTGTVAIALYTGGALTDPTGATKRTEVYNVVVSAGWNEIDVPDYDWEKNTVTWIGWCHDGGDVYYSSSSGDAGDFQSANGRWNQAAPADADETASMPSSPGSGSFSNYWYAVYAQYESPNYELDLEVQWTNMSYHETNEELAIYVDEGKNTHSLRATGGYMIVGDGTPDWGSTAGTVSFWVKMDGSVQGRFWGQDGDMETRFSGTNLVLDWGASDSMTSIYSFSADTWYFVAIVWNENDNNLFLYVGDENNPPAPDANSLNGTWTSMTPPPTENRFLNGLGLNDPVDGHGDDLRYWNIARNLTEIQSDYNTELNGSEPNLRSYFQLNNDFNDTGADNNDGSGSGAYLFSEEVPFSRPPTEDIKLDVWYGGSWHNLFTDLHEGWNNISVSSYLDSSTFTIRFKGSMESGDAVQDSWNIDVVLLHVWSDEYTTEVEFAGSSDLATWSKINWTTSMGWTIGSVRVTMQLHNYSLGDYSGDGDGCVSYISSVTAQEDQTVSRIVADNPNHFRNSTGHWMMKIKGVKAAETQFDLKVDWIELKLSSEYAPVVDWGGILVYALPVVFGLLFIPILIFKRKKRTDPSVEDKVDPFSRSFGMTHQQIVGEKMLLEIDPTIDFQKTLFNFATEAKNSDEKLYIFTSRGSPLHLKFSRAKDTEFYLLVSKAQSAQQKNPKETLLPANDLSVLLNTITRIQGAKTRKPLNILFDNLSDTILLCGFEKTYKFIRWLLEATPSSKRTILFVFNPAAHDLKTSSSIRGLFQTRLAHGKKGPKLGTL